MNKKELRKELTQMEKELCRLQGSYKAYSGVREPKVLEGFASRIFGLKREIKINNFLLCLE